MVACISAADDFTRECCSVELFCAFVCIHFDSSLLYSIILNDYDFVISMSLLIHAESSLLPVVSSGVNGISLSFHVPNYVYALHTQVYLLFYYV